MSLTEWGLGGVLSRNGRKGGKEDGDKDRRDDCWKSV